MTDHHLDIPLANLALATAHQALGASGRGHFFWLQGGTLLGMVRDGGLLPHDHDMDIAMWHSAYHPQIHAELRAFGFLHERSYQLPGLSRADTYRFHGIKFDVIYWIREGAQVSAYSFARPARKHTLTAHGFRDLVHQGRTYHIPDPPERWLEEAYGPDWRTPTHHWKGRMSPSATIHPELTKRITHDLC